jgi:hypothetical protein
MVNPVHFRFTVGTLRGHQAKGSELERCWRRVAADRPSFADPLGSVKSTEFVDIEHAGWRHQKVYSKRVLTDAFNYDTNSSIHVIYYSDGV